MTNTHLKGEPWRKLVLGPAAILSVMLAACSTKPELPTFEGIGFREARYQEVSAMRDFRECRDEAMVLDSQARESGDPARYLTSARLLERCESDLGSEASTVSTDERMRSYGLSIQNYIKGGDSAAARERLQRFKQAFPGQDFYYADGSSFRATMEVLLGQRDPREFGRYSMLNVNSTLKEEMRRIEYWKHN